METLISELKHAITHKFYLMALNTALTVPDICSAISSSDGKASGEKYKNWFDKYCGTEYSGFVTGDDIYKIRCASLHQGKLNHDFPKFEKMMFQIPEKNGNVFHKIMISNEINGVVKSGLNLNLERFVNDIIKGYEIWHEEFKEDENYKINSDKSIKMNLFGVSPYIVGVPIIA